MVSEQEMIDSDYDDLSDSDIIVLLIVDEKRPVLKSRLQKISLLYHELYEKTTGGTDHNAYSRTYGCSDSNANSCFGKLS